MASVDDEVVVIGAGFSGIEAGIKLNEAGIHDFVATAPPGLVHLGESCSRSVVFHNISLPTSKSLPVTVTV